jgi:hypothetical protein
VTFYDARSWLAERYTLLRSDRFIINAGLWHAIGGLSHAIHDTYETRLAWENAAGSAYASELERLHRRVHRDLVAKLEAAASAAGLRIAPQSALDEQRRVSGRTGTDQSLMANGEVAGGIPQPIRDPDQSGGAS